MKVRLNIDLPAFQYKGIIEAASFDDVVGLAKVEATPLIVEKSPRLFRRIVRRKLEKMSALEFARECASRLNKELKTNFPPPATCADFVAIAVSLKMAEVIPES